ncbi:MAG: tRNA preQ1(34) S-adenosylmethionine ribosyltransferase-isomerase QueA, partial [Pirellulales bacterium]
MSELDQYDYDLPKELIAQEPLVQRADARLLVVRRDEGSWEHLHVRDLPELLSPSDCLVFNDTKVVPARLEGYRTLTRGRWEGLFLEAEEHGLWRVLGKSRGKITPGETVSIVHGASQDELLLEMIEKREGGVWIAKPHSEEETFALLAKIGKVPLPHYIRGGEMLASDVDDYQTVYAKQPGAVAAPTAGLHFTQRLLAGLRDVGVGEAFVTLHVGIGTFRPITAATLAEHVMHQEWAQLTEEAIETILQRKQAGGRTVAVGTTSVRVLESAAMEGTLQPFCGQTDLFIRPPYPFRAVDALMTNFHLPKSTLLVLVSAFAGRELILAAYEEAVRQQYRFFSYG